MKISVLFIDISVAKTLLRRRTHKHRNIKLLMLVI